MARAGINKKGIRRELVTQLSRPLRQNIVEKTRKDIEKAVRLMLVEFDNHAVTKEIKRGPLAQNISGTLAAGNLFSFIGFEEGDQPISPVRKILASATRLVSIKQHKGKLLFDVVIDLPDKKEIADASPLPWAAARSWVLGIERGLSGMGQFLVKPGVGRSGGGVQISGQIRGGSFKNRKYISAILQSLQLNLMRLLKS